MEKVPAKESFKKSINALTHSFDELDSTSREKAYQFASQLMELLNALWGGAGPKGSSLASASTPGASLTCPKCSYQITAVLK